MVHPRREQRDLVTRVGHQKRSTAVRQQVLDLRILDQDRVLAL